MKQTVKNDTLAPLIQEKLALGSEVSFTVVGESMRPFFVDKATVVTLKRVPAYKKGDICLAMSPNQKLILHRIINITDTQVILRGDALKTKEVLSQEAILGKVIRYQTKQRVMETHRCAFRFQSLLWGLCYPVKRYLLAIIRRVGRR